MSDAPAAFDFSPAGLLRLRPTGRVEELAARCALDRSWLGRREDPAVLVAGADRVLGRWIVHLLAELRTELPIRIEAQGRSLRPLYLNQAPYRDVTWIQGDLADRETARTAAAREPDLVLFAEGEDDEARSFETLYRANVLAAVELARALSGAAPLGRFVQVAEVRPCPGAGPAGEDEPLDQSSPIGRCRAEAERALAELSARLPVETVSLRLAPAVGPAATGVVARLANLLALGLLPALPGELPRSVGLVSLADAAWGAVLLGLVDLPRGPTVYQLASEPADLEGLLVRLAAEVDSDCLLGVRNDLVRLFGLSFFRELRLPSRVLAGLQRLGEDANGLLNSLRLAPSRPAFGRDVLWFLSEARPLATLRFEHATQWRAGDPLPALAEMVRYHRKTEWRDLAPEPIDGQRTRDSVRSAAQCRWAVQELRRYRPDTGEGSLHRVLLPRVGVEIDLMSLSILLDKGRRLALGRLGDTGFGEALTFRLPGLWDGLVRTVRDAFRFEYHILLGGPRAPALSDVRQALLSVRLANRGQVNDNLTATLLDRALAEVLRFSTANQDALELVPDLRYGFLLETDLGLVGLVAEKREREVSLAFAREELGGLAGSTDRRKRLLEFKRSLHLDTALALPLGAAIRDLAAGSFLRRLLEGAGKDYLITSAPRYFRLLSREMFGSAANQFYYLNRDGRLSLGLVVDAGRLRLASRSVVEAYDALLAAGIEPDRLAEILSQASSGRVRARFEPLERTKRILAAVLDPGPLTRFLGAIRRKDRRQGTHLPPRPEDGPGSG